MSKIQVHPFRKPIASSNIVDYAHYTALHFRDSVTGDLCWIYGDSGGNHTYLYTQTAEDAAPSLVATVTNSYMTMVSSAQDASGYVHFLCYYSYGRSYAKGTLTRSGGHVTGLSLGAAISMPAMTNSLGGTAWSGTIAVINNGSSAERVMVLCIDGNDNNQYAGALCHSSTSPTATSSFLSLDGTASTWTKLPTQTCSLNVGAPYTWNASLEQYGSSGHFFADCGAASRGDVGDYSSSLVGYHCTASSTTWTVETGTARTLAAETDETLCGHSCKDGDGNVYFSWTKRTGSGTVTIGLSKVAADGTFTAEWLTTTHANGGECKVFPAVCSDGTVILYVAPGDTGSSATRHEILVYSGSTWYTYQAATNCWVLATDLNWCERGSSGWQDGMVLSTGASAYPATVALGSVSLRSATAGNVYFDNFSLPVYIGTATLSPTYATAVPHATRDMHVCVVAQKSTSTSGGTISFPSGWTERGEILGAGGYASQTTDQGNVDISIATKDSVDGSESGTISVTLGSYNTSWGMMVRLTKGGDGAWNFAAVTGSDTTAGTALSVAYTSAIALAPGDLLVIGWAQPTDVTTPKQFTAPTLTATGFTFSEITLLAEPDSATGNDIGGGVWVARVLTGTGDASVTFGATASGTTTNVRGGSVLFRAREVAGGATEYTAAPSESLTLSDSLSSGQQSTQGVSDSITWSESQSAAVTTPQPLPESTTIADALGCLGSAVQELPESLTLSELVAPAAAYVDSGSDSWAWSAEALSGIPYTYDIGETVAISDFLGTAYALTANLSEAVTLSDALVARVPLLATVSDSVSWSDALTGALAMPASLTEIWSWSDGVSLGIPFLAAVSETVTVSDGIGNTFSVVVGSAESVTFADELAARVPYSAGLTDTVVWSDGVSDASTQSYSTGVADDWLFGESVTALLASQPSLADSIDWSGALGSGLTLPLGVTDSWTLSGALSGAVAAAVAVSTSITVGESTASGLVAPIAISEAWTYGASVLGETSNLSLNEAWSWEGLLTVMSSSKFIPPNHRSQSSYTINERSGIAAPINRRSPTG